MLEWRKRHRRSYDAKCIWRRVSDNEVRLLGLIMRMSPGALLGDLDKQQKVFKDYWQMANGKWQMADANSFRAENKFLQPA